MPDYGIMKNSEGYFDPTAGTAIKNIAKPGEFWEFRNRGGEYREVLIVNNNGDFCNILHVLDECKKSCVKVDHGKYANPQMLNWTHTGICPGALARWMMTISRNLFRTLANL